MATHFPKQLVGVVDGTLVPAALASGAEIGAATRVSILSKVTGTAWASGDTIPLGKKPAGHKVTSVKLATGTSLATSTIDVGTAADPDKYVDGATLTTVDRLTEIGVIAATLDDDPGGEEDLIATVGVATIEAGTVLSFIVETTGVN